MEREGMERINKWMNGGKGGPYKIEIRPTNQCNLNCISCKARGNRYYNPNEELKGEELIDIVKEAKDLGVKTIHLSGSTGEPLFKFYKTFSLMKKIKEMNIRGEIVTNGTLFKEGSLKKLVKIGWDKITFSLDAPQAQIHDYLRGNDGTFESVVKNIRDVMFWKDKLNKENPEVTIAMLITSKSYDKIKEMLYLCKGLNIDSLFLQTLTIKDRELGGELLLDDSQKSELKDNMNEISKLSEKLDIPTNIEVLDEHLIEENEDIERIIEKDVENEGEDNEIPCYFPWYFMEINSNGVVEPCGTKPLDGKINIKENSLKEIWYGDDFQNFRKRLKRGKIPQTCTKCCGGAIMTNRKIRKDLGE